MGGSAQLFSGVDAAVAMNGKALNIAELPPPPGPRRRSGTPRFQAKSCHALYGAAPLAPPPPPPGPLYDGYHPCPFTLGVAELIKKDLSSNNRLLLCVRYFSPMLIKK
jgi:hypothetical protein